MSLRISLSEKSYSNKAKNQINLNNLIITINTIDWLQLPSIDLIHEHKHKEPTKRITINDISCNTKGTPSWLSHQIQKAYYNSFNNYKLPFNLDSLIRFSPYCKLEESLPKYANFFLGITVGYIEKTREFSKNDRIRFECNLLSKNINKEENMKTHDGWIAIDFGTSNSTVTFYDPSEGISPNELSLEQKELLFKLFEEWLILNKSIAPYEKNNSEWQDFIKQVENNLDTSWQNIIERKDSKNLLEGIRQLEILLGNRIEEAIYPVVRANLNEIYHQLFRLPPLQRERIVIAKLDKNLPQEPQISSELELKDIKGFLEVEMGSVVRNKRLQETFKLSKKEGIDNQEEEIESKFHPSPKRYLNKIGKQKEEEKIKITWKGNNTNIEYSDFIQAAIECLIKLTEEFKDKYKNRFDKGSFYKVVITYPTVSKPETRRNLEKLVCNIIQQQFEDLDIEIVVNKDFDEAIAAALFYLWREFGGNQTLGIEAFKTRCREDINNKQKWDQNLLVLDIGGGTTDVALIRLLLKDDSPFDPGEDRGAGGSYYVLTPELRGSSGHLFLGGELITLRLFRILKVAIVDNLLTAFTEEKLNDNKLDEFIRELDSVFKKDEIKYSSHSLLECIDRENQESNSFYSMVLNYAESLLPTRWKEKEKEERRKSLQNFYMIWRWADDAKVELSKGAIKYKIPDNFLKTFLNNQNINLGEYKPEIIISKQQLERAASEVIEQAINIAKELVESRLPKDSSDSETRTLDWLILSGQTCNLDLVKHKINEIFSNPSNGFDWNPARTTFVPKYAKLATSIGACYGMSRQQLAFSPVSSKDKLKRGESELYIEVNNLLYTLPCSFLRQNQAGSMEVIFQARQELYQFTPNDEAKARSAWVGILPATFIYRRDFENQREKIWASFDVEAITKKIGIYSQRSNSYYENLKAQFEVNQTLEMEMLLCRGEAHYLVEDSHKIKLSGVNEKIEKELKTKVIKEENVNRNPEESSPITRISREIINNLEDRVKINEEEKIKQPIPQAIVINGVIQWDIAIGINEKVPHIVFKAGEKLEDIFHSFKTEEEQHNSKIEDRHKTRRGCISRDKNGKPSPIPAFPKSCKHMFYAYYPELDNQERKEIYLGTLGLEKHQVKDNYRYYVTIDEQSNLCLHEGEVPYWMSNKLDDLKEKEGCVVRVKPSPIEEENNDEKNPFSGTH